MNREIILEMPTLTLWYYSDTRILHQEVRKYPGLAALEASLEKGLELLQSRGAHKWLSDDRRGAALPKSHHEWGQKVWGPKAAKAGWKYWAVLLPTAGVGATNVVRLIEVYGALGVTVKTFDHPTSAMDWLVTQAD